MTPEVISLHISRMCILSAITRIRILKIIKKNNKITNNRKINWLSWSYCHQMAILHSCYTEVYSYWSIKAAIHLILSVYLSLSHLPAPDHQSERRGLSPLCQSLLMFKLQDSRLLWGNSPAYGHTSYTCTSACSVTQRFFWRTVQQKNVCVCVVLGFGGWVQARSSFSLNLNC